MNQPWEKRIGNQRDWVWRGWQTRYTYLRPSPQANPQNPPLILLHGFGAAIEHWRNNIPVLSEDRAIYALDLLGFGASRKVSTNFSVHLWAEQVYDFWDSFIRAPVVLVGNSIGSLVCAAAAAAHPEMAKGLVFLSFPDLSLQRKVMPPWVATLENVTKKLITPLVPLLFQVVRRPGVIRFWVQIAYVNADAVTDELVDILALPPQDEGASETLCALFQSSGGSSFNPPGQKILPQLDIPILLIWGRQDRMVPISLAQSLQGLNPHLKFIELDNAGHCPHDEYPERFNALLLDWLKTQFA